MNAESKALDEWMGEIDEPRIIAQAIEASLDCAETCETVADFFANIDEAIENTKRLLEELRDLRMRKGSR